MLSLGIIGPWQLSIAFLFFILPIIALIDILPNKFTGKNDKLIWVLVVLLLNGLGSIFYFIFGRKQKLKRFS